MTTRRRAECSLRRIRLRKSSALCSNGDSDKTPGGQDSPDCRTSVSSRLAWRQGFSSRRIHFYGLGKPEIFSAKFGSYFGAVFGKLSLGICNIHNVIHPTTPVFTTNISEFSDLLLNCYNQFRALPLWRRDFCTSFWTLLLLNSWRHIREVCDTFSIENLNLPFITEVLLELLRLIGACAWLSGSILPFRT